MAPPPAPLEPTEETTMATIAQPPLPDEPVPDPVPLEVATAAEEDAEKKGDGEPDGATSEAAEQEKEGGDEKDGEEEGTEVQEAAADEGEGAAPVPDAAKVHKGKDDWQAVWSQEANAYYFWNSRTQETTWTNPLTSGPTASTSTPTESTPTSNPITTDPSTSRSQVDYGGIDPDLAYLDPSLSRSATAGGGSGSFSARFNARTGRFQGDAGLNPDRISEFSRGKRQQEAFYNVQGWEESLGGRGLKRGSGAGEDGEGGGKKRVTAKDVERFKEKKLDKKKKKLTAWLKD